MCTGMTSLILPIAAAAVASDASTPVALVEANFEAFYRSEYPGLVAVATALSGRVEDGEELTQDTMVKAFMRWGRLQHYDKPGGWCHRVLVNGFRSWFRRRRTEAQYVVSLRRTEAVTAGPSADVVDFWAAVRALPTRPGMVVALHYAGDRSVAEIGAILGVPEGTVRSDLTRARRALATALGDGNE